jgi:hypothetical protein
MQEVAKYNKMVQDKAEEINLLKHKHEEYKKTEKHQKGSDWMEDAFVKFKLIDARNIAQLSRNSNVVFFAAVGDSSCQTKVLSPNEPIIINEIFTFENISSKCKVINLFIYTEANFRDKNYEGYIGKLTFQLSDYQDQKESMPVWMKFEERDLHINKGEIRFTVQFIYSYVKIYEELIEAREKECTQYEDFLEDQGKLLAMLQSNYIKQHHSNLCTTINI